MSPALAVTPVDGHVHLHRIGLAEQTLTGAARNFAQLREPSTGGILGCLLLAESSGDYVFQELLQSGQVGRWHIRETHDEPHSAIATCDGRSLAMIAGRQIRTAENLEVLALGTVRDYPDGLELAETLELVHNSAAVAVLPWGLGKWTGARLATLTELLKWVRPDALFLGDNGGRLGIIDAPPLLVAAQSNGFRILPGSDPLPLPGDWKRVGSFGFRADIDLPDRDPWRVLRDWLTARASSPAPYGQPLGLVRFLYNQIGIQVLNRWKRVRA